MNRSTPGLPVHHQPPDFTQTHAHRVGNAIQPSHPLSSPVLQPQASCILHQTWTGDSFLIWYYTCFNAILPNHPTLSLSHRVQKTVLYICISWTSHYISTFFPKLSEFKPSLKLTYFHAGWFFIWSTAKKGEQIFHEWEVASSENWSWFYL